MNNEATHDEPCVAHEPTPNAYLTAQSVPEPKTTLTMSEARWLQRAITSLQYSTDCAIVGRENTVLMLGRRKPYVTRQRVAYGINNLFPLLRNRSIYIANTKHAMLVNHDISPDPDSWQKFPAQIDLRYYVPENNEWLEKKFGCGVSEICPWHGAEKWRWVSASLPRAILMPLFQLAVQFGVTKPFDYAPPHLMTVAVAYPIAVAWDEDFYPVFKRSTPA